MKPLTELIPYFSRAALIILACLLSFPGACG